MHACLPTSVPRTTNRSTCEPWVSKPEVRISHCSRARHQQDMPRATFASAALALIVTPAISCQGFWTPAMPADECHPVLILRRRGHGPCSSSRRGPIHSSRSVRVAWLRHLPTRRPGATHRPTYTLLRNFSRLIPPPSPARR